MNRTYIIQSLINKINANSYLEIGIGDGINFKNIQCNKKISVDPDKETCATFHLTSDIFFKNNTAKFDVIFIDGLHHADQVLKDIEHSLQYINKDGYIICHDMNPLKEEHQTTPYAGGIWNGDCWKAFVDLREKRSDLEMYVVDIDFGCGIIKKGKQDLLDIQEELTFQNFTLNKKKWLNLISLEEFNNKELSIDAKLSILLEKYILDSENPDHNYNLGLYYESIGQTASALSYFLRCAERSDVSEIQYECLVRSSNCFEKQGKRNFTVKGLLQHAISICPRRPEAYYLLSRFYEKENNNGSWQDSYMIASIGESIANDTRNNKQLLDYPGFYGILFQKGVAAWWCGLVQESRDIFLKLLHSYDTIDSIFIQPCLSNLSLMNTKPFINYNKNKHSLNFIFTDSDIIQENYSEAFQDIFVLTMLDGKKNGTYLEIGSGHPVYGNNTFLLENIFGWNGIGIDIDENAVNIYNSQRKNKCVCRDASALNYEKFLSGLEYPKHIDYLQIDCDPPDVTYSILLSLPLDTYRFSIITYEHDSYADHTQSFQDKASVYLEKHGYVKILKNIAPDNHRNYEDWWIHPQAINADQYNKIQNLSNQTKNAHKIFLKEQT